MRLVRALRDCKQRSLTVSKKAPTVSKKASPNLDLQILHQQKKVGLKIVILGADLYKRTRQETSKCIHIIFEGRKILYVSAKFYIFGNSGPWQISSVCQTFRLDGIRRSLRGSLLKGGVTTIACTYLWRFLLLPPPLAPDPLFSSLAPQGPTPYPPFTSPYPGPPVGTHKHMR